MKMPPAKPVPFVLRLAVVSLLLAAASPSLADTSARIEYARGRAIGVDVVLDNGRSLPLRADGPSRWAFRGDPEELVGRSYRVVIVNPNDERLKVVVGIDGVNVLFKQPLEGDALADLGAIVNPRSDRTLKGWQVTGNEAEEFVFAPSRWSEGSGVTDADIGRIEVHVYRELRDGAYGKTVPPGTAKTAPGVGTAAGEVIDSGVRRVQFVASTREPLVQAVISYGRPGRGGPPDRGTRLGISGQDADQGVLVTRVEPGSLADEAGLRQGDVITRIDSSLYPELEELRQILRQKGRRDSVVLELRRGRHEVTMKIRL